MRFDFELQTCIFRSKNESILMQSEYAKCDRNFYDLIIRWPKSSDFGRNPTTWAIKNWPKIRRSGLSDFPIENCHGLLIKDVIHDSKQQQNGR